MKPYPIQLEISGPTALWTRPDTGSSPVSYVAPTFSAVKGIFESVLRWKSVNVRPTKVEICAPVQFHRYTTNYGGPLRASDAMNKGASCSLARRTGEGGRRPGEGGGFTVVLVNVCYRLYAQAEFAGHHDGTTWPPHAYHDVFNRALEAIPSPPRPGRGKGEVSKPRFNRHCPFRPETRVCEIENHELPNMLRMVFDQTATFAQN